MQQNSDDRKPLDRNLPEILFYAICWALVLLAPLFREAYDWSAGYSDEFDWTGVMFQYISFIPFLILFVLCKQVLEPRLFFRGRIALFITSVLLSATLVTLAFGFTVSQMPRRPHRHSHLVPTQSAPPPPHVEEPHRFSMALWLVRGPYMPMLLTSILMIGSCVAISSFFRSRRDRLESREQQAALLQSELDYLKYQINPHFFMNTLNNIHALVDVDAELAKSAIIELSRLMRYLLYESNQSTVPLSKEVGFVCHYIELMKLRCDDTVSIECQIPTDQRQLAEAQVPPLLLISFIENAFKHGISHRAQSYISISLSIEGTQLHFCCRNSDFSTSSSHQQQGGVGLDNVRKRLDLIYPDHHQLDIHTDGQEHVADLRIPLVQPSPKHYITPETTRPS